MSVRGAAAVIALICSGAFAWESRLLPAAGDGYRAAAVDSGGRRFRLGDFSYAGFRAGEAPIPEPAVVKTLKPVAGDNAPKINAALRALGRSPVTADGFRGSLLLGAGIWTIESEIRVADHGIVIRGEGPGTTHLSVASETFCNRKAVSFTRFDSNDWTNYPEGEYRRPLIADAAYGDTVVKLDNTRGLRPGDMLILRQMPSLEFSRGFGANGINLWPAGNDLTAPRFCRQIRAVTRNTVVLTEPLRWPLMRSFGAHAFRTEFLQNVGIENLSIGFRRVRDNIPVMTHRSTAIAMDDVMNGWIRNVKSISLDSSSVALQSYGIVLRSCKWVTVQSCSLASPQNKTTGGNGYLYNPVMCDDVLIKDCRAVEGRHNYTLHYCCSGVVITGCSSRLSRSDHHQYLAVENLFDNFTIDRDSVTAGNRGDKSQGAWWCSARATFWNFRGAGALYLNSYDQGFLIGAEDSIRVGWGPEGVLQDYGLTYNTDGQWIELSPDGGVPSPVSLYAAQLRQRLAEVKAGAPTASLWQPERIRTRQ